MKPLIKSIRICLESLLDNDDAFFDSENDKKLVKEWINDNNACVNIWKGTKETYEMALADVLNSSN